MIIFKLINKIIELLGYFLLLPYHLMSPIYEGARDGKTKDTAAITTGIVTIIWALGSFILLVGTTIFYIKTLPFPVMFVLLFMVLISFVLVITMACEKIFPTPRRIHPC